jgi:hypothetical protein
MTIAFEKLIEVLSSPTHTANVPYRQVVFPTGGTGAVTLAVSDIAKAIPGLVVPTSGATIAIFGTPTAAGTMTFTVTATDSLGAASRCRTTR